MTEHLDVVIVGAGISGVSAAWHLQDRCPTKSYAILEKRESMGGTWDLFRYPGIRSDSDMYTLGFRFRPWTGRQAIADGKPILEYVKSTAAMYGIDRHIRFHHKVISADWSTAENRWTVHIQSHGTLSALTCEFVCRLLNYMDDNGFDTVVVERPGSDVEERPFMEFTPGYVLRSLDELPKQGSRTPWRLNQNYLRDIRLIRRGKIDDEGLRFAKRPAPVGV